MSIEEERKYVTVSCVSQAVSRVKKREEEERKEQVR